MHSKNEEGVSDAAGTDDNDRSDNLENKNKGSMGGRTDTADAQGCWIAASGALST